MVSFRFSRLITLGVALAMIVALAPALPRASAQGGTIAYGQVVSGQITAKNYFETWQFTGTKGDRVQIYMEGDGNLDPYVGLVDLATETVLAEDDDSGGNTNAYLEMTLQKSGEFVIVATRYDLDTGTTVGSYTLELAGSGGPTNVSTTTTATTDQPVEIEPGVYYMGEIALDEQVGGSIENNAFAQIYGLQVEGGTELVIGMFADGSSVDSYLIFADEEFNLLAEDDDSGATVGAGTLDSFLSLTVPASGLYYVVATRAGMDTGTTTGAYVLLATVPEPEPDPVSQPVDDGLPEGVDYAGVMSAGDSVSGTLTATSFMHLYDFEGQAGEEITISMTGAGNLDAYLGLFDPAGEVIAEDDDSLGALNAVITVTLPQTGTYLIAATRAGIDEGTTVGDYTLEVSAGQLETPAPTGFSGFGGLPGRAMVGEGGTLYLRGNGASDNPEKSPPLERFFGVETTLPGTRAPLAGLLYPPNALAPFSDVLP